MRLVEAHDPVHGAQRQEKLGTLALGQTWPAGSLEGAYRGVAVEAHDEQVAEGPRRHEVTYVPDVQHVEAAVGEHHARRAALRQRRGGAPHVLEIASGHHASRSPSSSRQERISSRLVTAVPRRRTTRDAA